MPSSLRTILLLAGTGGIAALLTCGLITALFPWLERYALARPNARSSHVTPTAQGGGTAVILATIVVTWSVMIPGLAPPGIGRALSASALATVTLAVLVIAALGAVDDVRPLPVMPRLVLQVITAGVLVATVPPDLRALPLLPAVIESAILTIGLVWFINLTNFMDGLDEMTVVEFLPATVSLAVLGLVGALPGPGAVIAAALAGALVGFWPWNRHVARLFLGDVGSLAIGALVGWLLILLAGNGHLAAALILPLYYLVDATLTLYRRWRRGERLSEAHRSHFYQRATASGRTVPQVTRAVLGANLALSALAFLAVGIGQRGFDVVAIGVAIGVVVALLRYLVPDVERSAP